MSLPRIAAVLGIVLLASTAHAQVTLDGTIGDAGPGLVLPGTDDQGQAATYLIHDGLGEQSGGNLYFSFDAFSIGAGETATFMSDSLTPVDLVMSRVTGGSLSQIDGTLRSTIPGAAIFLMNPAGVAFGAGSSLDIPGSLHIATSEYLRHTDGSRFVATAMPPTALSTAPIDAFGFLNAEVGTITVEDTRLELGAGETLSLVGGDITVLGFRAGTAPDFENKRSAIRVPSGRVNLAAVASAGEVVFDDSRADPRLEVASFETLGNLRFGRQASLTADGDPGGTVVVRGHDLAVRDPQPVVRPYAALGGAALLSSRIALSSVTQGTTDHPGVALDIDLRGKLELENSSLTAWAVNEGRGGDVRVRAGALTVTGPQRFLPSEIGITTWTAFHGHAGDAGDVRIEADRIDQLGRSNLGSLTWLASAGGDAGDVTVSVGDLTLDGEVGPGWDLDFPLPLVGSVSNHGSSGRSGNVTIHADAIGVFNAAAIATHSGGGSTGNAGSVAIETGTLKVSNATVRSLTATSADGGSVDIKAYGEDGIEVTEGGTIDVNAVTDSSGNGGSVALTAERIEIEGGRVRAGTWGSGNGGSVTLTADKIDVRSGGLIAAPTFGPGNGGSIEIEAGEMVVEDASRVEAITEGAGDAGTIEIAAERLKLRDWADIRTQACFASSPCGGSAGDITITADAIELLERGFIGSDTFGTKPGGNIAIRAGSLLVEGVPENPWRLYSLGATPVQARGMISSSTGGDATAEANAGMVSIVADQVRVLDSGLILSFTSSAGAAGVVEIISDDIVVSGVNPRLEAILVGLLGMPPEFAKSGILASNVSLDGSPATGAGGVVRVRGGAGSELRVEDGGSVFSSTNSLGSGGNIDIDVSRVVVDGGVISTRSYEGSSGDAGSITIRTEWFTAENGGSVTAASAATDAGDIEIQGGDRIELFGGVVETSVDGGPDTAGGNIQLTADIVVVDGDSRLVANAFEGQGGNIQITTQGFFPYPGATIDASSEFGVDGTVVVNTPEANLTAALAALSERYRATDLARNQCAAGAQASRFVVGNATGVPEAPDAPLPSFSLAGLGPP